MTDIRQSEVTHLDGTKGTDRWCNDCGQAFPFPSHRCGPEPERGRVVRLTDEEIDFLSAALDSHEYWQLSESNERNDGASQIEDGENADVDFGRAIAHRLSEAKEGRATPPAVRGEDDDEDDD